MLLTVGLIYIKTRSSLFRSMMTDRKKVSLKKFWKKLWLTLKWVILFTFLILFFFKKRKNYIDIERDGYIFNCVNSVRIINFYLT